MGKQTVVITGSPRLVERVSREDQDLLRVMGRKVQRVAWEQFMSGHIGFYNEPACSYRNPIFLTPVAEASFHLSALAKVTKDESLANLFAFAAAELQEEKPVISRHLLIRFARIALSRAQQCHQRTTRGLAA